MPIISAFYVSTPVYIILIYVLMIAARFNVYKFDRMARPKSLLSVSTEWPNDDKVDVVAVVRTLHILYPLADGVNVDFGTHFDLSQRETTKT